MLESNVSVAATVVDRVGMMFYAVDPRLHLHEKPEHVPDYVGRAVPLFLVMIFVEACVIGAMRRRNLFNLKESLCSISLGLLQIAVEAAGLTVVLKHLYPWVHDNLRFCTVPYDTAVCWVALFLGVDFCYYWMHRFSHEFHIGWIGHSVHHSGEYYNLSTALRQGVGQSFVGPFFYLPLALVGLPPSMFCVHKGLNLIYQFWIHTELVGSLGPLEYVLNTPSHHRMHHRPGGNCNYAAVLIIWDRIFGSFRAEEERKDLYGLGGQLSSFDPLAVNSDHARKMLADVPHARGSTGLLKLLTRRRLPARWVFSIRALLAPIPAPKSSLWRVPDTPVRVKYPGGAPRGVFEYLYLATHLALAVLFMFSPGWNRHGALIAALGLGWIALTLSALGRLADGDDGADALEALRALAFGLLMWQPQAPALSPLPIALDAVALPPALRLGACCAPLVLFAVAVAVRSKAEATKQKAS